ncbi:MAG: isoaspartyl peptidase/L-asparaginase [Alphaproteobacteria bacterium]|nr:isoaspartyl peptidase/L-asparaginase [Alphaproteobacteria bacterium]
MKRIIAALAAAAACAVPASGLAAAMPACHAHSVFAIAVHGGEITAKVDGSKRLPIMAAALALARQQLSHGARSIDVVEEVVRIFEDSGAFNAGRGAIADSVGLVETDAAVMDGNGMRAGAVGSMTNLKNPIVAARLVMHANRHVLMVGDRGQAYAIRLGAVQVPRSYFIYNHDVTRPAVPMHDATDHAEHGTVGAVALDRCGHLSAATSTGGYDAKIPGRVGDSPLVGDGVYAADDTAAFSGTGWGEYYIRYNITKDAADRMRYGHETLDRAMQDELFRILKPLHADGGLIGVDRKGNVGLYYNSVGMFRGYATDREAPVVAEYTGITHSKPRSAQ